MNKPTTVDQYIRSAPKEAQKHLREMRATLKSAAPKAKEAIKWGSPVLEEKSSQSDDHIGSSSELSD